MAVQDYELLLKIRADMAQAVQQLNQVQAALRKTSDTASSAGGGFNAAGAAAGQFGEKLKTLPGLANKISFGFHDLRNILVGAFAVHEIGNFTSSLIDANVQAQRIQYTLQQAFGKDGAAQQFQFVIDVSKKLGLSLQDAAEGYAQLAASAQGTGLQTKDLQKFFIGLSEAASVFHLSAEDVNGVLVQLSQGLSLGKLHMQDLRAIAQHLPGTMTAITEAVNNMGFSLSDALKKGIPAVQLIGNLGDVLQERFARQSVEASESLNAEINKLKTTLFEATTQGNDFSSVMTDALKSLNGELSDPGIQKGLQALVTGIGEIASAAITATAKIGEFMGGVRQIAQYAAAQSTGVILNDTGFQALETRLKADQAELTARSGHSNVLSQTPGRLGRALFTWSDSQSRAALKSTKDLETEVTDITQKIDAYRKQAAIPIPPKKTEPLAPILGKVIPTQDTTGPDKSAIAAARKTAREAAAAQKDLTQSLIDLQGQLDPTAAIWAKYNAAVEKANDDAAKAKLAHGASATAIDAQKNAVIQLAARVRDAALDKQAEQAREAWESLKRSFESPAQVAVDDALKKIAKLNDLLKQGVISEDEYHQGLSEIGKSSVPKAPQYNGLDAAVGGVGSELLKNFDAQNKLDAWYQQQLAANESFRKQDTANEEVYQARLAEIDQQYANQRNKIEQARGILQLKTASDIFGQLATLSSSQNSKIAAIGKAAAIAQTIIKTYQSATEAYASLAGIPYIGPALGAAAAAAAIAAGLANVAQIRAQSTGGYSEGGYTGPGAKHQVAGVVHAGEVVWSQTDVARAGGVGNVEGMRLRGYADGGYVNPLSSAPSPAELGFTSMPQPRVRLPAAPQGNRSGGASAMPSIKFVAVWDREQAAHEIMNSDTGQKVIVQTVGDNPLAINGKWNS